MKLTSAIESLGLDLLCLEKELSEYFPPTCKNERKFIILQKSRQEIKKAIEILKDWEKENI